MTTRRLNSLDVLRGLDLFLLVFLQPVLLSLLSHTDASWSKAIQYQLDHEVWQGFRFWDLVMPLFLFMSGISMPFALSRFIKGEAPASQATYKILRRFIILFVLGMIVQGNLLWFRPEYFMPYNNTLQAIATGYLITAILLLSKAKLPTQIFINIILLASYTLPMMIVGDYTPTGNLASHIDAIIMGSHRGDPTYAWILPSINFAVTVWFGALAGQIIRLTPTPDTRVTIRLTTIGAILIASGLLWSIDMPIIKRIWTSSMTLYSAGLCFMLIALFYQLIDVWQIHTPFTWLKIYGMNSIVAYTVGETIDFRSIVSSVSYGLAPLLGEYYDTWLTFGNFAILLFILTIMYRSKTYIKI